MVLMRNLFLCCSILMISSCSILEPGASILRGNYAYQNGEYQKALLYYLDQEDQGSHKERILHNIATIYYALGEGYPALELWGQTESSVDDEVLFAASFNSAVVFYQSGQFHKAYYAFKKALNLDPGSLDAKKNLELTIERLEAESRTPGTSSNHSSEEVSDDARRILQYIKRKEGPQWKNIDTSADSDQDW